MKNTILPAVVQFIVGAAGGEASQPPSPSEVVAAWASVENFTTEAIDLFQSSKLKPVQGATAQYLQALIVAMTPPTAEDEELAIVNGHAAKTVSGTDPPHSIFHAKATMTPEVKLSNFESRADVYMQMLFMRLDDLWRLCITQLKLIAIARSSKRLRIVNALAEFAGCSGSGNTEKTKALPVAAKSLLKSTLIQVRLSPMLT